MDALDRKILDASIALIAAEGVRAVSFREVARRAGVSHQAPYHRFGDHLGILRAIAREGFRALTDAMRGAAAGAGDDALEGLCAAGVAYVRFARDHVGHFRVMFQRALVDLHDAAAPIAEAEETHGTLLALCGAAAAAGQDGGIALEALTALCWSTVHGLATLLVEGTLAAKGPRTPADDAALAGAVVGALRDLLRSPPRRRQRRAARRPSR